MILKGNIRAGGQELARHLMNDRHEIDPEVSFQPPAIGNERVEVAELRGFASSDLAGAFRELEGVAAGTNCTKPIYSLSINPSQPMTREEYGHAIGRIEQKLGLTDQARAVVFHVKDGREHCHVAWSRIDLDKMQARHMEFDRQKLREVARELVREFGHDMPRFLGEDRGADRFKDRFKAVTLAERGQEERTGFNPLERKACITELYHQSDSAAAFRTALQEHGFMLAQGDKRAVVVVDHAGEVHALSRQIEGVKAREIRETLQLDQLTDLPTVQEAKERQAEFAREKAAERPQEREDPADRVKEAECALEAVRDAQKAEEKALRGAYREQLAAIRDGERERIDQTRTAIKEAYRPEWRDLFKQQRAELDAVKAETATRSGRLKALLSGRAGDAFDFENRNTLAGAFNFILRGQLTPIKLEKAHKAEQQELGDRMRLAEREELRAIRQESKEQRGAARDQHNDALTVSRETYAEQLEVASERLDASYMLIQKHARDVSEVDNEVREGRGFGGMRRGFESHDRQSFDRSGREDDDDERPFKPPSQNFNP